MAGFRGYVSSRPFSGQRVPQHVQNIVIRDYCRRKNFMYLLSAVEYVMPNCYVMLEKILSELPSLGGIVCYSLFQLPEDERRRQSVYEQVFQQNRTIHFAVESLMIENKNHADKIEEIWHVQDLMTQTPSLNELVTDSEQLV